MPNAWYSKPWRRTPSGRRAVVAACLYLATGAVGIALILLTDGIAVRLGWAWFTLVCLGLGATLAATLSKRRRLPDSTPNGGVSG